MFPIPCHPIPVSLESWVFPIPVFPGILECSQSRFSWHSRMFQSHFFPESWAVPGIPNPIFPQYSYLDMEYQKKHSLESRAVPNPIFPWNPSHSHPCFPWNSGMSQSLFSLEFWNVLSRFPRSPQLDTEYRKKWDSLVLKLDVVERDPATGSEVIHWATQFPYPMYSRDYVYVRRYTVDSDRNLMVLVSRWVFPNTPGIPKTPQNPQNISLEFPRKPPWSSQKKKNKPGISLKILPNSSKISLEFLQKPHRIPQKSPKEFPKMPPRHGIPKKPPWNS
uniref:START domain-containing protein n=1 Tax=Zosterops lateralis melanops TaxID=1220523 RepID=A0A8D2PDI3_ZOSLA